VPDYRTDRIDMLIREGMRLDPPDVRGARQALMRARADLRTIRARVNVADHVRQAYEYRVDRAFDVFREAQRHTPARA
jgi:hypothetical protein